MFRILDLQANGPGRATQGDRLILAVNLLHVGDEGNFLDLIAGRLLALGGGGGFATVDPLAQRAAAFLEGDYQALGVSGDDVVTNLDLVEILDFVAGEDRKSVV